MVRRTGTLLNQALRPSTQAAYQRAWDRFLVFTSSFQPPLVSLPALPSTVAMYVTSLVDDEARFAASTITSALSAIAYRHKLLDYDPTSHFVIKKLLTSINNSRPGGDVRIPISHPVLCNIIATAKNAMRSPYEAALAAAMFSTMFAALLRVGEVTSSPHIIMLDNVQLSSAGVTISFVSFKHHQGRPITLTFAPTGNSVACPLRCSTVYARLRGSAPGPWFAWSDGRPITPAWFRRALAACLSHASITAPMITPHSFRIGAATHAAASGMTILQIKAMGRWNSDAFARYIRLSAFRM